MKQADIDFYMDVAIRAASRSHAERTQVGAVIVNDDHVMAVGYNGTPSGWDNKCEHVNHDGVLTTKSEVIHAELNALFKFIRNGVSAKNCTMFLTLSPCIDCAKAIHLAEVKALYYLDQYRSTSGLDYLSKTNVNLYHYQKR